MLTMKSKTIKIKATLTVLVLLGLFMGCQKDPYDGVKSNEKSIENFTMGEGFTQIGAAVVDRTAGKVKVKVLVEEHTDFSNVRPIIQQSYRASVSPNSGEQVNFLTNDYKFKYQVTAETGETREWEVEVEPFEETITGTYDITDLVVYGGTGPEYVVRDVLSLTSRPWIWLATNCPQVELENKFSFTMTVVTPTGRTTEDFINDAGGDGLYAHFIFNLVPQT